MKRLTSALILLSTLTLAPAAPGQNNATDFAMIGITRGQTLQLNIVAYPADPCYAHIWFQDSNGNPVGPSWTGGLTAGDSASIALNGNTLAGFGPPVPGTPPTPPTPPNQRVELLPMVTVTAGVASNCVATAEVIDNGSGVTTVLAGGVHSWPPQPVFGDVGVPANQTVRLNVVAFPNTPCAGTIGFVDWMGNPIGKPETVSLAAGHAAYVDYVVGPALPGPPPAPPGPPNHRTELRPVVSVDPPGVPVGCIDCAPVTYACVASVEVYSAPSGATTVYVPAQPCAPGDTSCLAP